MKTVLVVFGGMSAERDISVLTGVMTANCLKGGEYSPVACYVSPTGEWYAGDALFDVGFFAEPNFKKLKRVTMVSGENSLYEIKRGKLKKYADITVALNCLHGAPGEDGSFAGYMNMCKIPIASPPMFASALSMDKSIASSLLKKHGFLVADGFKVERKEFYSDAEKAAEKARKIGYPLIIKPASNGSSIGISVAKCRDELVLALRKAFLYDEKAVVEKYLAGAKDVNCAAVGLSDGVKVSAAATPRKSGEFFSFADKYLDGDKIFAGQEKTKDINDDVFVEVKKLTKKIYELFSFSGIVRVDYLLYEYRLYVNEINAVPGSLSYYLFSDKISAFTKLLTDLLNFTLKKHAPEASLKKDADEKLSFNEFKGAKIRKT